MKANLFPKLKPKTPMQDKIAKAEAENRRLKARLAELQDQVNRDIPAKKKLFKKI